MKEFNLGEYLKNPERKVVTRDGRKVRIICTDRKDADYPIVVLISNKSETGEDTLYYTEEGKFYTTGGETPFDLFFESAKHEGYACVYLTNGIYYLDDTIFSSKEEADKHAEHFSDSIATIKIEWEN